MTRLCQQVILLSITMLALNGCATDEEGSLSNAGSSMSGVKPSSSPAATEPLNPPSPNRLAVAPGQAPACRNSTDPACGPFRWDPQPAPNQPIQYTVSINPEHPQVGEEVTFVIEASDPDAVLTPTAISLSFGDASPTINRRNPDPCDVRYGPWTPPDPAPGHIRKTYQHVYESPGSFPVAFTIYSDDTSYCAPPQLEKLEDNQWNPYASYDSYIEELYVAPPSTPSPTAEQLSD